jgi:hypothetical protein
MFKDLLSGSLLIQVTFCSSFLQFNKHIVSSTEDSLKNQLQSINLTKIPILTTLTNLDLQQITLKSSYERIIITAHLLMFFNREF